MNTVSEDKTVAIVSYITLLGWIIAIILHNNNRTEFGAFHLRQSLGLILTGIILWFIPIIGWILNIIVFVFWIIGLVNAIQGEKKPVPIVGEFYQNIFKGLN
ncbi:MAG: hypothetical protein H8D45_32535 [Bacteroidetes bacterium]|nr:hypothetical protein [Bacteroidota bacterium]MBL7103111.1 hypothetical protein [Bacteroidales bacterium]